jgi:hypothetical protein
MRTSTIIVSALFAVFLLVMLIVVLNEDHMDLVATPAKLAQLRHAAGLFIASAAALFLLIRALAGDAPGRLVSLVLPFLAGVLLVEPNWGVALALAATAVATSLRPWLISPTRRLTGPSPPHTHPAL